MTKRISIVLALALYGGSSHAMPKVGDARPAAVLKDAWDHTFDLANVGQRALLVVYEDKDSSTQNQLFKDELSKIARGNAYASHVVLAAIADLDGYDYWPARGFVKSAIRSQSTAIGTTIYCDWHGSLRTSLALKKHTSTIILYGTDGRVVFTYEGAMDAAARANALRMLHAAAGL